MVIDIQSGISAVLKAKKKRYQQHTNRISALDDPCLKRLYLMRAAWDKAQEVDDGLQGVFETGNLLEPVIERIVSEVGMASTPRWRIVGSQLALKDDLLTKYQISGTIDGLLQVESEGRWQTIAVVDLKTMSSNVYPRINCYEDLVRYPWTAKYRGQLQMYALGYGIEQCCLLLVNKNSLYDMKMVFFPLDMGYCEGLLQKAEAVNLHIMEGVAPEGVNDPRICTKCAWLSYCCPPINTGGNMTIEMNDELEAILDRMGELEPQADEYADLEKQRDKILTKGQDIVCGKWVIQWHQTNGAKPQWRKTITNSKPAPAATVPQPNAPCSA